MTAAAISPAHTTVDSVAAQLATYSWAQIEFTRIDPVPCEACDDIDAAVIARIYGPRDADTELYTECCVDCVLRVATHHAAQGYDDVLVELHTPKGSDMGIFKNASKKLEQIVREEIDEPRRRARENDEVAAQRAKREQRGGARR